MSTDYVVIGAGYGDEGKGLMTDYLARRVQARAVLRFNGGAQAGHTVQTPEGKRHVFGHVGSGTFAGARTFLSSNFITNVLLLHKELDALRAQGLDPVVRIDEKSRMSTIYDMAINALIEEKRGTKRHGSCGVGINETVTRHEYFPLFAGSNPRTITEMHKRIKEEWVPRRLKMLGIEDVPNEYKWVLNTDSNNHSEALIGLHGRNVFIETNGPLHSPHPVIFEGAQGLMLDEYMGHFPFVTRSLTGLPYAIKVAHQMGRKELTPVYVTRAYSTRHGAGPLELEDVPFTEDFVNSDATNIENKHQGSIRFAPLQTHELKRMIDADLARVRIAAEITDIKINVPLLAVTCVDQLGKSGIIQRRKDMPLATIPRDDMPVAIANSIGIKLGFTSYGPTFQDVRCVLDQ